MSQKFRISVSEEDFAALAQVYEESKKGEEKAGKSAARNIGLRNRISNDINASTGREDHDNKLRAKLKNAADNRNLKNAAANGKFLTVSTLLKRKGVDCNKQDSKGRTALHFAVASGHVSIINLLLKHGANPNLQDTNGNTPLHLAALSQRTNIVSLLLQHGALPDIVDGFGKNAKHVALSRLSRLARMTHAKQDGNKEEHDPLHLAPWRHHQSAPTLRGLQKAVHEIIEMLEAYMNATRQADESTEDLCRMLKAIETSDTIDNMLDSFDKLLVTEGRQ
eukprot:Clim_evm69s134 gene=Clim_evmTU69s134